MFSCVCWVQEPAGSGESTQDGHHLAREEATWTSTQAAEVAVDPKSPSSLVTRLWVSRQPSLESGSIWRSGGVTPSHTGSGCVGREGCRATHRRLARQGLLKDSQTEPVLPTELALRGAGECARLKRTPALIPAVHIHNAGSRKGTAEE